MNHRKSTNKNLSRLPRWRQLYRPALGRLGKLEDVSPRSPESNIDSILKISLSAISALGILMMCLGFGVVLALDEFGVDIHQVLHGPGDYLAMAAYVVVEVIVRLGEPNDLSTWHEKVFIYSCFGAIFALSVWAGVSLTKRLFSLTLNDLKCTYRKMANRLLGNIAIWRPFAIVGSVASVGLTVALIPYLFLILLVLCILPFWVGIELTNHYLYESVVEPISCRPYQSAAVRRATYFAAINNEGKHDNNSQRPYDATCLKVESKQGVRYGRRVIATSEYIVLFAPVSGSINIVSSKDSIVSVVDKLEE